MQTSQRIATVLVSAPLMLGFGTAAAAAILPIGLAPIASADTSDLRGNRGDQTRTTAAPVNPNGFGSVTSQRALNDHDIGSHVSAQDTPHLGVGNVAANDAAEFGAASDFTRTTIVDTGTRPGDHAFAIGPLVGYDPLTRPGTHETATG